ncbi:hypothetical protein ACHAQJ_002293 [Trichoderma viride]
MNRAQPKAGINDFLYHLRKYHAREAGRYSTKPNNAATSLDNNPLTAADDLLNVPVKTEKEEEDGEDEEEEGLLIPKRLKTSLELFTRPAPSAPTVHRKAPEASSMAYAAKEIPMYDSVRPMSRQNESLSTTSSDLATPGSSSIKRKRNATNLQTPQDQSSEMTSLDVVAARDFLKRINALERGHQTLCSKVDNLIMSVDRLNATLTKNMENPKTDGEGFYRVVGFDEDGSVIEEYSGTS